MNVTAIGEILYDVYPDIKRLGGAPFNFIYHVWKISGNAAFISSVGDDENGKEILGILNSLRFDTAHIYIDKQHPTGTVRVKLREDKIPEFKISPECSYDYIRLSDSSKTLIEAQTNLLYFGTLSARNEVSRNTILSLFGNPDLKYFCDLNLRHNFYSKELIEKSLHTCSLIKINGEELNKLKQFFLLDQSDAAAVRQLINTFNIDMIGLTRGRQGAELFTKNGSDKFKNEIKNLVDTLGAGDAYSAVMCLGYLNNWEVEKINRTAVEFASDICMIDGAIPENDSFYLKYRNAFGIKE